MTLYYPMRVRGGLEDVSPDTPRPDTVVVLLAAAVICTALFL